VGDYRPTALLLIGRNPIDKIRRQLGMAKNGFGPPIAMFGATHCMAAEEAIFFRQQRSSAICAGQIDSMA
jgi:hypothetical protein